MTAVEPGGRRTAIALRVAVAVAAVLALGWLGVMERDHRLRQSALEAASSGHAEQGRSDLRRSRLLNPDTRPDVERALILGGLGDVPGAIAGLEDVLRREPDNLTAWGNLLILARPRHPAVARRARAAVLRLDPLTGSRAATTTPR